MKHSVTPLFSIPLFQTNIGAMDIQTKAWIMGLEYPPARTGHDHSDDHLDENKRGMSILDKPELTDLKIKIKEAIDFFAHDVLDIDDHIDFKIDASWVNRHTQGEFISRHNHANAMLSGVYYIETTPMTAPIVFEKAYLYNNLFHETVKPTFKNLLPNQFNSSKYTVRPTNGDLIMFPSHLEHTVPNLSTAKRYSLAFNCFARGSFGVGTEQITL
jgi:uncharacterized protein (TIGR02466 family)